MYGVRVIAMFLTFLYTLFSFTTCSVQPPPETPVAAPEESVPLGNSGPVIINILQPRSDISLALQESADLFLASTGMNAQINIQTVQGQSAYGTALRARFSSGAQVDLYHLYGARDLAELADYASDLSDLPWITDAMDGLLAPVTTQKGVYGVPYGVEGVGLIANTDIFQAADIPLASINTFEDLTDAFLKLRAQIDSGELAEQFPNLEAVTEFPAHDKVFLGEQLADIALTDVFVSPGQAAETALLGFVHGDALEQYVRAMARYSASSRDWAGLNEVTQSLQVENGLATGRVAVVQQNVRIASQVHRQDEDMSGRLALLPIPLKEAETSGVYVGAPSYWAVNAQSSPEAIAVAKQFLTWLYHSETGAVVLAERFEVISPYRQVAKSTGFSLHSQLLSYMEQKRTLPWMHAEAPMGWGGDVFAPNMRGYLGDTLEWEDMLAADVEGWGRLH